MTETTPQITLPAGILPSDGRFGQGPARCGLRPWTRCTPPGVISWAPRIARRRSRTSWPRCSRGWPSSTPSPKGYEIVMGLGGSNAFWDVATFGLIERRQQNLVFGEFTAKFATSATAPFLEAPDVVEAPVGSVAQPRFNDDVDTYAWAQNETSTGVMAPVQRVAGAHDAPMLIDAT